MADGTDDHEHVADPSEAEREGNLFDLEALDPDPGPGHAAGTAGTDDTDAPDRAEYGAPDDGADWGVEEEPPSYRSGRVRIIGAEPAGDTVREVTGPVVGEHPELQHWGDAPTGQVPAVLDTSSGEEHAMAPPTWREEHADWEAHEEAFEPSMLSDDLPGVGALAEESDKVDVVRQPWHFESEDTLVIPPDPGFEEEAAAAERSPGEPSGRHATTPEPVPLREVPSELEPEGSGIDGDVEEQGVAAATTAVPVAAATRRNPSPADAQPRRGRPPRAAVPVRPGGRRPVSGQNGAARAEEADAASAGTSGRDMRVAVVSGVALGVVALLCFAAGPVATMVIVCVVVLLASAEAYAAFRRAQYHPATLLGLVGVLSLLIETYNKGVTALPLVLVLLVAGSFVWYLARVEPGAEPVSGMASTVFVFVWVGVFGSFAALLLNPTLFPDRHGIAFLLAAVIVTVTDDVASLLVGSAMGRRQLAPSISPNKSWEGLIGGGIAAVLVSVVVVHFIHPWTIGKAALFGVVVAVVAPLGDLCQSMIKRNLGLKDMGRLLPGHGGVLDRVDGLLFVIPATYFVVKALHLG